VLGFLSMVLYCFTKTGISDEIGVYLFGKGHENKLLEVFEQVHYMLFFIMIFFVINVHILMCGSKRTSHKWWLFNRACLLSSSSSAYTRMNYPQYLLSELFPRECSKRKMRSELQLFRGLRKEFIAERSPEPPFAPETEDTVNEDFDFGSYLTTCQSASLSHMVHLSSFTWISLAVATVIFYFIGVVIRNDLITFAWIWMGAGWLLFLLGSIFDYHMVQLLDKMVAPPAFKSDTKRETSSLLHENELQALPAWTQVDLDQYMTNQRSSLKKMLLNQKPTRQDTLYWFETRGPKVYEVLFQMQMMFTATYVSLLCLTLLPLMVIHSDRSISERVLYFVFSVLPVCLLLSKYQIATDMCVWLFDYFLFPSQNKLTTLFSSRSLTKVCSIGNHRKPAAISYVEREEKTATVIWHLVTLTKLKYAARDNFVVNASQESLAHVSKRELQVAESVFKALDANGDGFITAEEIRELFIRLGTQLEPATLDAIVRTLDIDNSASVCLKEFLEFYKRFVLVKIDHETLRDLAIDIFAQIDTDKSGEITMSELKHTISQLHAGFSLDEIGALVAELDETGDGAVTEHEFMHLILDKHYRMFEHAPLPSFE